MLSMLFQNKGAAWKCCPVF